MNEIKEVREHQEYVGNISIELVMLLRTKKLTFAECLMILEITKYIISHEESKTDIMKAVVEKVGI